VQEGPQGGGQLLRAFELQLRGPPLDEAHDIAGTQACERDAAPAESIGQELAPERHVIRDGRLGQHALVAQVGFERVCLPLDWGLWTRCDLRRADDAVMAQKVHEVAQRGRIPSVDLGAASARSQISRHMLGGHTADGDGLLSQPSAETRRQQNLPIPRRPRVSLVAGPLRKRRDVRREWTVQWLRQHHVVIDDAFHSGSFPSISGAIGRSQLCRVRVG
jgi:hypothetical protein